MRNLFLEPEATPLVFRFVGNTVFFSDEAGERLFVDRLTHRSTAHGMVLEGIRRLRKIYDFDTTIRVNDPTGAYSEWMKRRSKTADIPLHVY